MLQLQINSTSVSGGHGIWKKEESLICLKKATNVCKFKTQNSFISIKLNLCKIGSQSRRLLIEFPFNIKVNKIIENIQLNLQEQDIVRVDMYYESLCPGSIDSYKYEFLSLILSINKYLDVHTYPFGGAKVRYFLKFVRILLQCFTIKTMVAQWDACKLIIIQ